MRATPMLHPLPSPACSSDKAAAAAVPAATASALAAATAGGDYYTAGPTAAAPSARPASAAAAARGLPRGWEAHEDPAHHGAVYYHHRASGVTSWERPAAAAPLGGGEGVGDAASGVVSSPSAASRAAPRPVTAPSVSVSAFAALAADATDEPGCALPLGWEAHVDAASGATYYYDRARGVTSWDPPASSADTEWFFHEPQQPHHQQAAAT